MVYSYIIATYHATFDIGQDINIGRSSGNCDEVGSFTDCRYTCKSTIDSEPTGRNAFGAVRYEDG